MVQTRRNQQSEGAETANPSTESQESQESRHSNATGSANNSSRAKDIEASVDEQLAKSQASRTQAEGERQRIAGNILEATREACQELIADGEKVLKRAKQLEADAERKNQKAQATVERSNAIKAEADTYAEKVMTSADAMKADADSYYEQIVSDAKQQAEELLEIARTSAQRECDEMKQQASFEAKQMLGQAQVIRAAAQEELEAHRIYAEAARLNAESHEVLVHARSKGDDYGPSSGESAAQTRKKPASSNSKPDDTPGEIEALAKEADAIKKMSAKVGQGGSKKAQGSSGGKKSSGSRSTSRSRANAPASS